MSEESAAYLARLVKGEVLECQCGPDNSLEARHEFWCLVALAQKLEATTNGSAAQFLTALLAEHVIQCGPNDHLSVAHHDNWCPLTRAERLLPTAIA